LPLIYLALFLPLYSSDYSFKNNVMNPERDQHTTNQANQRNSEGSNTQATSQEHRPDWIIPDNGTSSRSNSSGEQNRGTQEGQQDHSSIPLDNEDTLGIP
jgi:replication initiation and membrane attachment protein DnaB